ncbi:hypothetical protein ACJZ2D_014596 [Fusarium nematophilum]
MKTLALIVALASASVVAQAPIAPCAQTCALDILSKSGCASTDVACVCKSQVFVTGYTSCIDNACDAKDAAAAKQYGVQLCGSAGVSVGAPSATEAPYPTGAPSAPSAPVAPSAPTTPAPPVVPTTPVPPAPQKPTTPAPPVPPVVSTESQPGVVTPTAVVPTAGAGMVQGFNAALISVGLSFIILVLMN